MASLATTTKRVAKHPTTRRIGWIAALGAAAAATVGTIIYFGTKSSAPSTPAGPPAPANTKPVWTALSYVANPQVPGSFMVQIPAGASFAFADSATDPNLASIVAGLNAATNSGTVTGPQSYAPGTPPPSWWPSDGLANNGYRATGVANQAFSLNLGPFPSTGAPGSTPQVWVVSGFTSA